MASGSAKRQKWSSVKSRVTETVEDAVEHWEHGMTFKHVEWFTVPPPIDRDIKRVPASPPLLSEKCKRWSAARIFIFTNLQGLLMHMVCAIAPVSFINIQYS